MSDFLRIEVTTDAITTVLAGLARAYDDLTPLNQDIGEAMLESTMQNFLAGTAPDGTPWAPRSQSTLDAYTRRNPPAVPKGGAPCLTDTLEESNAYEATPAGVSWGNISPRPYLGIGDDDESAILGLVSDYLGDAAAPTP